MKLPAKIEYAYKAVIELSLRYQGDAPVQVRVLSRAQKVPEQFLIQLLLQLKNARIVNSSRGVTGGYFLARQPSQISLADVIRAVDENIAGTPQEKRSGKMPDAQRLLISIWSELNSGIQQKLEAITFDQLISRLKKEEVAYQI